MGILSDSDKSTITTWVEHEFEGYVSDCDDEPEAISYMEMDLAHDCKLDGTNSELMDEATQHLHEAIDEQ